MTNRKDYRFVGYTTGSNLNEHGTSLLDPIKREQVFECQNCGSLVTGLARNAHNLYHIDTKTTLPPSQSAGPSNR